MSLGVISPIRNKGLYSDWLSAAPLATSMLTIDTSGNVGSQAIPVAAWGSITGTLSSQTDLQNALDAKLSLSGGTMTGALSGTSATFSSTVTIPAITGSSNLIYVAQNQTFSWEYDSTNTNPALRFTWGGAATTLWGSSSAVNISVQGTNGFRVAAGTTNLAGTLGLGSVSSPTAFLRSDGSNTIDIRNSTNAQRLNLYGTYTDASNYRRLHLSSTTAGAFTLGVEGLGTGASGNTLAIGNSLTVNGIVTPTVGTNTSGINIISSSYLNNEWSDIRFESSFTSGWKIARLRAIARNGYAGALAFHYKSGDGNPNTDTTEGMRITETGLVTFGGTTSSFPAIKRNAAAINFRLADDSGDAEITAGTGRFSGAIYNVGPIYNTSSASSNVYAMYASQYGYAFMRFDNWKTITFNAGESTAYEHSISIAGWRLNTNSNGSAYLHTDAANIFAQRNSTNAQTLRIYGTYTDASNYRRLYISSTTAGAFTLGVEGAGTGASGNTLTVANATTFSSTVTFIGGDYFTPSCYLGSNIRLYGPSNFTVAILGENCSSLDQSNFKFRQQVGLGWSSTSDATASADVYLRRNAAGQLDVRGDSGLRVRNLANTADAAITAGAGTFSSYVYTTADAAATLPLRIRGAASQSANLTEWQSSTGGVWIRVTSNGTIRSATGDQYTPTISNASWGPGHGIIVNGTASCAFAQNNDVVAQVNGSSGVFEFFRPMQVYVQGTGTFATITADTSDTLAFRRSTNTQRFNLYNTFTDTSNYIRQSLSFTTYSSTVHAQLAAEGAGTGAVNVPFVITPRGTGAFIVGPMPDGTATGGNARGAGAVDIQTERNAATQVASNSYLIAIGSRCTATGNSSGGTVAIGRNVNVSDSLGGAFGAGLNTTVTGYRGVAIGAGATAGADSIAIGTGSYASNNNAICIAGSTSRWNGTTYWKLENKTIGQSYLNSLSGSGFLSTTPTIRTTNSSSQILDVSITSSFIASRQRHRGAIIYAKFSVFAVRSDGAINKYDRRVVIKDVASLDGTTSTLSILATDTIGTDITEISGASISIVANSGSKTLQINVTGEPSYVVTGNSTTDVLTAVGHPFANNDIVVFTAITGGAGLSTNINGVYYEPQYKVINVSGNDFQLTAVGSGTTPINFTTDITAGTICRPIVWSSEGAEFHVIAGGY